MMSESIKAVSAILLIVGVIAGMLGWIVDRPDAVTWGLRVGGPALSVLAAGVILRLQLRPDLEPDYLRKMTRTYFNRDGLCFAFFVSSQDGIAVMDVFFQSQYDNPLQGRIALRPAHGFFLTRAKIDTITFDIDCPPAGFGYVRLPIPIPQKIQGKRQSFEVGASVDYPEGKGGRVRFFDGLFLRSNSNFRNAFGTALAAAGAMTGTIVLSRPATASMILPKGVMEEVPDGLAPECQILWQLGDPPLPKRG